MPSEKRIFSRAALAAIDAPETGRIYYRDEGQAGLILDVTPRGTKTFQLYRKIGGKPVRVALGRFDPGIQESFELPKGTKENPFDPLAYIGNSPRLNVRMARGLATAVSAALDRGENPSAEKREARRAAAQELTLREAFDLYDRDHLIPQGRKSAEAIREDFARYLGDVPPGQKKPRGREKTKPPGAVNWEGRKLSSIKPADIRRVMAGLKEGSGARAANKSMIYLRAIFRKMNEWRLFDGNPAAGIPKYPERERSRFLKGEELPRFFEALAGAPEHFRHFVLLALATGARRANLLGMRWADIDFHAALWTVPGEVSKNGAPMVIPLTAPALAILEARKAAAPKAETRPRRGKAAQDQAEAAPSPWVFPARSASGHMQDPKKQWTALRLAAGLEDLRLHDMRRSLGSWAAMMGVSSTIIGAALGHKSPEATRIYTRLATDPIRDAMDRAIGAMLSAGKIEGGADILPFRSGQK